MSRERPVLRLAPEYGADPLWLDGYPIEDLNSLGLSRELLDRVSRWNGVYQATYHDEYPPDSGFATIEELEAFRAEGERLRELVEREVGDRYDVELFPELGGLAEE